MLLFYNIHKHYNSSPVASWDSKLSDTSITYCQKQHVVVFFTTCFMHIYTYIMFYTEYTFEHATNWVYCFFYM